MTILPISSSKNAVILSEIEGSVPRAFSSAISTFYLVARATSLPGSPQATGGDPSASPCLPSVFLLSTFHFSALPPPRPPCLRVNTVASATQSQGSSRAYSPGRAIPSRQRHKAKGQVERIAPEGQYRRVSDTKPRVKSRVWPGWATHPLLFQLSAIRHPEQRRRISSACLFFPHFYFLLSTLYFSANLSTFRPIPLRISAFPGKPIPSFNRMAVRGRLRKWQQNPKRTRRRWRLAGWAD